MTSDVHDHDHPAPHSHPHEQVVYVVSGHLKVSCLGKTVEVRAGDSFLVGGGVEHGASALEDSHVVDIFTPCREDYIPPPKLMHSISLLTLCLRQSAAIISSLQYSRIWLSSIIR